MASCIRSVFKINYYDITGGTWPEEHQNQGNTLLVGYEAVRRMEQNQGADGTQHSHALWNPGVTVSRERKMKI